MNKIDFLGFSILLSVFLIVVVLSVLALSSNNPNTPVEYEWVFNANSGMNTEYIFKGMLIEEGVYYGIFKGNFIDQYHNVPVIYKFKLLNNLETVNFDGKQYDLKQRIKE